MYKLNLNANWSMLGADLFFGPDKISKITEVEDGWIETDLPCDIHMPLIENGIIKDPVESDNCFKCEWTENKSWWFKKIFYVDEKILEGDIVELTLESLDSESDVFLNGTYLGHHASAHYPFIQEIKCKLKKDENILMVRVTSGLEHYSEQDISGIGGSVNVQKDGIGASRGDRRRIMVRKPQYVFGWDWGPRVATCGIVKNVYIKSFSKVALREVHVVTKSISQNAELQFMVKVDNLHPYSTKEGTLKIQILFEDLDVLDISGEVLLRSGANYIDINAVINEPNLWWPNGIGEQNLYKIKVKVESEGISSEYEPFLYGIRTIELNLDKINEEERNFVFVVNGVKIFCKGGNWIPADSIYARVTYEKYDTLINEARQSNFNMLRIWGGGIYETDTFYEKCDEYGILVWHDFMFACAAYPDKLDWFKNEVENEMVYQTKRLRNHACLALWCGNNENHWGFDEWWVNDRTLSYLGGESCYNEIAPRVIRDNCPNIPYWNSSPYGGEHPNGNDYGDRHHWHECTMNPDMDKRITPEEYDKITSKFISEYGYIGPCAKSSIQKYHGDNFVDKDADIWQIHNNTYEKKTVPAGIKKHYSDPEDLTIDEYLLYAGLCQGLMLGYSLESIRYVQNCSGSLFWMYNDCWGEVGWTIIDYYLKRKPSFYYVKRAFSNVKLILREVCGVVKVMGINDTKETLCFDMEYGYIRFDGSKKIADITAVELQPYTKEIVFEFDKGENDFKRGVCYVKPLTNKENILSATLRSGDYRELDIPKARIEVSDFAVNDKDVAFTVCSDVFAHAVHFGFDDEILVSDEYFDLLPGESRKIIVYNAATKICEKNINPSSVNNIIERGKGLKREFEDMVQKI